MSPLGSGANFTGVWEDTTNYGLVIASVHSDQESASDGFVVQWSSDGVAVVQVDKFNISAMGAGGGKVSTFSPANKYFRIFYTNGATPQTDFDIQVIYKPHGVKSSSHRLQDSIVDEDDVELVKAIISAKTPDGAYENIEATDTGNLKVSLQVDSASEHKFGFQAAVGKLVRELIWDVGGAYPAWPGDGTITVESSVLGDTSIGISVEGLTSDGTQTQDTATSKRVLQLTCSLLG